MRRHLFACEDVDRLVQECRANASGCVGVYIPLAKDPLTFDDFVRTRLGLCRFVLLFMFAYYIDF